MLQEREGEAEREKQQAGVVLVRVGVRTADTGRREGECMERLLESSESREGVRAERERALDNGGADGLCGAPQGPTH